jgi:putative glutamine amidotransferase
MSARRPLIAVTGRRLELGRVSKWLTPGVATPAPYLEAISRAGGLGVVLMPEAPADGVAEDVLDRFDGLLLTGGADLDPAGYGQEPVPETYGVDPTLDAFELALLDAARRRRQPVLAVCRGLQLLNVAHGGTLDQHITGQVGLAAHGIPNGGGASAVPVEVEDGSRLAGALGTTSVEGQCHHHQAVAEVGVGLRVTARAGDGVVEGLEPTDGDGWVVAVQWHPEESAGQDAVQQRLFDTLVVRAGVRAAGE